MEYVIVGLLVLAIILLLINLLRKNNNTDVVDRLSSLELSMVKEIGEFKVNFASDIRKDFDTLDEKVDRKLTDINNRVTERLDQSLEKTNKTFANVLERLSKIDEAQKKIELLSSDIVSLQSVLTDKKSRGIFGEVNLKHILVSVFGENPKNIYQMQYSFSNGTIADCVLFAPEPLGLIAIDSKFPLENYQNMVDRNNSELVRREALKGFKADMKKHIDAISSKYIIPGVTADQAILFLPAEAIFAEINAYHQDLIDYSYNKKVWITSPTTLISTLTTIQIIMKNIERDKYAKVIHDELKLLDVEFSRYRERWDKLSRSIDTVSKDVKDLNTTTDKITKRFNAINQVDVDKLDNRGE